MFLHLSASHSIHMGVCIPACNGQGGGCLWVGGVCLSPGQTALPRQTPFLPWQTAPSPPPRDGHCSGRYASYWNAFLFTNAPEFGFLYFSQVNRTFCSQKAVLTDVSSGVLDDALRDILRFIHLQQVRTPRLIVLQENNLH